MEYWNFFLKLFLFVVIIPDCDCFLFFFFSFFSFSRTEKGTPCCIHFWQCHVITVVPQESKQNSIATSQWRWLLSSCEIHGCSKAFKIALSIKTDSPYLRIWPWDCNCRKESNNWRSRISQCTAVPFLDTFKQAWSFVIESNTSYTVIFIHLQGFSRAYILWGSSITDRTGIIMLNGCRGFKNILLRDSIWDTGWLHGAEKSLRALSFTETRNYQYAHYYVKSKQCSTFSSVLQVLCSLWNIPFCDLKIWILFKDILTKSHFPFCMEI